MAVKAPANPLPVHHSGGSHFLLAAQAMLLMSRPLALGKS